MKNMKNENAVSPVIGVILMVVITVIIAAVLAVFAFGVAAPSESPTASIKITSNDPTTNTVWVQHFGGDAIRLQDTKLTVETLDVNGVVLGTTVVEQAGDAASGQFAAGDTLAIDLTAGTVLLNGGAVTGTVPGTALTADLTAATIDSVRVTVIDVPSGSVLSKPAVKVT